MWCFEVSFSTALRRSSCSSWTARRRVGDLITSRYTNELLTCFGRTSGEIISVVMLRQPAGDAEMKGSDLPFRGET